MKSISKLLFTFFISYFTIFFAYGCDEDLDSENHESFYNIGLRYFNGDSTEIDHRKAAQYFLLAANAGNTDAQFRVGLMYLHGKGGLLSYKNAINCFKKAAESNHPDAQFHLAYMYENALGCSQNIAKAFYWYLKAGENNHPKAQNTLGNFYSAGRSTEKNYSEALKWYEKSARNEVLDAQFSLAKMYYYGNGTNNDYKLAYDWFLKAANQGHIDAQFFLGCMYEQGEGVDKDVYLAYNWYMKAGSQNQAEAIYNIGYMYENGIAVVQSKKEALKWYIKSYELGYEAAKQKIDEIEELLIVPALPAKLIIKNLLVRDANKNLTVEINEKCNIEFTVENQGLGEAKDIIVSIKDLNQTFGLKLPSSKRIGRLNHNESTKVVLQLEGNSMLCSDVARLYIEANEINGFDARPLHLRVKTRTPSPPSIVISSSTINSQKGGLAKNGDIITLKLLVENRGNETAKGVQVNFSKDSDVVTNVNNPNVVLGDMPAHSSQEVSYSFSPYNLKNAKEVVIYTNITDITGEFNTSNSTIVNLSTKFPKSTLGVLKKKQQIIAYNMIK